MTIATKLVKDGNSTAVRLPKTLLALSGLSGDVELEAKEGQIIITQSQRQPREGWEEQIKHVMAEQLQLVDDKFEDMNVALADGLDDLPWDGPTYEEWLEQNEKS